MKLGERGKDRLIVRDMMNNIKLPTILVIHSIKNVISIKCINNYFDFDISKN